ncbi:MAG: NAD(P)/FAD-dependent oxidoreductase [Candidatus Atribacteria bacterium]|nr:NAD(P)/FAD-dependent oxidoreductase [Candidatus Atribacteria bacterium]
MNQTNIPFVDYKNKVMDYVRETTRNASKASKARDLLTRYGVEIIFGNPKFLDNHHLEIDKLNYQAKKFIICTGSSPAIPKINGLRRGYLTNQTIWKLKKLPDSLLVIGGGPIGIELAQAFHHLGTRVTLFNDLNRLLIHDDAELAEDLTTYLKNEDGNIHLNYPVDRIIKGGKGWQVSMKDDKNISQPGEHLLIALGRKANVEDLSLEAANISYNRKGIKVNRYLKTSAPNIWAAGDCIGRYQFSHIAELEAKLTVRNALLPLNTSINYQGAPWTTFTEPELAHLGYTEEECKEKGLNFRVYRQSFEHDDRAITEGTAYGKVKILTTPLGKLLGAHILGPRAGELMNELVLAKRKKLNIYDIGLTSHIYPTLGLALQRTTDEWFADWGSKLMIKWLLKLMTYFS